MNAWIVCGNRLEDGRSVYRGEDAWFTDPALAARYDKERAEALAAGAPAHFIAGAEAVALDQDGALARRRERIRAEGPTVRPDLGRKAEDHERT